VTATESRLPDDTGVQAPIAASAGSGARLRAGREAAGMSLDQVAQQLKLAPRQVKALEDENFGQLPGRTFSRGFVRNYARLLNLDPEELLLHLPDVAHAPALGSPALHSTGAMIAELPSAASTKPNFARWMIPLALVACIIAAAAYEWYRGGLAPLGEAPRSKAPVAESRPNSSAASALPNPLASGVDDKVPGIANASIGAPAIATKPPEAPAAEATATDAPLVLVYAGPSWTEVRDRTGQLLVSRLVDANSVEPVRGTPPFDVVLGNAPAVTITYHGKPVDLTQYTRQNVAHFTLP
jgi:cytoskeleton protein RodZ